MYLIIIILKLEIPRIYINIIELIFIFDIYLILKLHMYIQWIRKFKFILFFANFNNLCIWFNKQLDIMSESAMQNIMLKFVVLVISILKLIL